MRPIRVLHVVGALNRGGVETWLVNVLRHIDRERFKVDFLVHTDARAAYDDEVIAMGSRIIPCPNPHNLLPYAARFLKHIRRFGPFDVLHSHVHAFSGFILALGRLADIPILIGHSHSDCSHAEAIAKASRKAYRHLCQWLIKANLTHGLAASSSAANDLFGLDWECDSRIRVLFCGVDLAPFRQNWSRAEVRAENRLNHRDVVFGHVGRFDHAKNHLFLAQIASEIVKRERHARFMLIGDGPLRAEVEEQFRWRGIGNNAMFLGLRADVPRLMCGAMDAFVFPSLHEGLGLALVEAQAAGLPCTVSDSVPVEADIVPGLVHRLSLGATAAKWAEGALRQKDCRVPNAIEIVERSQFEIAASVKNLTAIYSPYQRGPLS